MHTQSGYALHEGPIDIILSSTAVKEMAVMLLKFDNRVKQFELYSPGCIKYTFSEHE